jgi:hypothetical protein
MTDRSSAQRAARRPVVVLVVILLLGAGAIAIAVWQRQHDRLAVPPTEPGHWRTEQYRDITFEAPVGWGYDFEPGADWCVASQRGGGPERRSYVALGERTMRLDIGCGGPMPSGLIVEHVAAIQPAGAQADGRVRLGHGFWEVTRTVGTVTLRAVSQNPELAQRIVDSGAAAGDDAPCRPTSPMQTHEDARPEPSEVTAYGPVVRVALCQYVEGPQSPGLRAADSVFGAEAQRLIDAIAKRPPAPADASCGDHDRRGLELAVVIRVATDQRLEELYLRLNGCSSGTVFFGGFDDGTTIRTPDRDTCQSVMRPPLIMQGGGEAAYRLCAHTR